MQRHEVHLLWDVSTQEGGEPAGELAQAQAALAQAQAQYEAELKRAHSFSKDAQVPPYLPAPSAPCQFRLSSMHACMHASSAHQSSRDRHPRQACQLGM
jgi:hypothetical protein